MLAQAKPSKKSMHFVSVLNTSSPGAGVGIAFRWAVVMRGGKNPRVLLFTSNAALGWGFGVFMPTCWVNASPSDVAANTTDKRNRKTCFIPPILVART
jgi:hypothetical protein